MRGEVHVGQQGFPYSCAPPSSLQVMPWPNFGTTPRDNELSAIYDYLSALPHTEIGSSEQCTPDPQGVAGNQ